MEEVETLTLIETGMGDKMSWYKKAKDLQELIWNPDPDTKKDNYVEQHLESDIKAVMEKMYQDNPDNPKVDKDLAFSKAIKGLSEVGGDFSMWRFFIEKNEDDPSSNEGKYLEKVKKIIDKKYDKFYSGRKKKENTVVPGAMPPAGPSGDDGGMPPL